MHNTVHFLIVHCSTMQQPVARSKLLLDGTSVEDQWQL
jgi:hypothetical protein